MKDLKTKAFEFSLISVCVGSFIVSASLYLADFPIEKYFISSQFDSNQDKVAEVKTIRGDLKRKASQSASFKPVKTKEDLFNYDTLVTGSESQATIEFTDGSSIDLSPKTMVTLAFETSISMSGIARAPTVNVFSGKVAGKAKKAPVRLKTKNRVITLGKAQPAKVILADVKPRTRVVPRKIAPVRPAPISNVKPKPIIDKPAPPKFIDSTRPLARTTPAPDATTNIAQPDIAKVDVAPADMPDPAPAKIEPPEVAQQKKEILETPVEPPKPKVPKKNTVISLISPRIGSEFKLDGGSRVPSRPVNIAWKTNHSDIISDAVNVVRVRHGNETVFNKTVSNKKNAQKVKIDLKKPGKYEIEIEVPEGEKQKASVKKGHFFIKPDFKGIETMETLIGGKRGQTNAFSGAILKDFSLSFRWKPYPNAKNYKVDVYRSKTASAPVISKTVDKPQLELKQDKVFSGQLFYKVSANLESGFVANSGFIPFRFDFLPPRLVTPKNNARIPYSKVKAQNNEVLFTWEKTNFTEGYQIEVSRTPEFKKLIQKKITSENFMLVKIDKPGNYWWRARSLSKGTTSPPSAPNRILIGRSKKE